MATNKLILLEIVHDQIHFLQMFADTVMDGSPHLYYNGSHNYIPNTYTSLWTLAQPWTVVACHILQMVW